MPRYSKEGIRRAEQVAEFGRKFVVHKKDRWAGKPFELEPWQWEHIILPIYGTLQNGQRRYRRALLGLPRFSGKSETVSLMVMFHLFVDRVHEGECYVVASNERQANIVFQTVKRMIQANPRLAAACDIFKREIWVKQTGCVFKALPADADSAQGFHPSFCAVDEVHVHKSHALIEAMVSGMVAREEGLLVCITTAGPFRRGVLWEMLHGSDEYTPWASQHDAYVYWAGATDKDDPKDPAVWRKANPASWVTDKMLEAQFHALPLTSFERYHLNRFPTAGVYPAAIPADVWMSEANRRQPVFDPDRPSVMAVDAADKRDRTAFTTIQVDASGDYNIWCDVRFNDREREYADYLTLEADLRTNAVEYNVERIGFDRRQMARTMAELEDEGYPVEEVNQGNELMCAASQFLFDLAATGKLRHGGDPVLAAHIASAAAYERPPYGWRFAKADRNDPECKIDAAISTAMAAWMAQAESPKLDFSDHGFHSVSL